MQNDFIKLLHDELARERHAEAAHRAQESYYRGLCLDAAAKAAALEKVIEFYPKPAAEPKLVVKLEHGDQFAGGIRTSLGEAVKGHGGGVGGPGSGETICGTSTFGGQPGGYRGKADSIPYEEGPDVTMAPNSGMVVLDDDPDFAEVPGSEEYAAPGGGGDFLKVPMVVVPPADVDEAFVSFKRESFTPAETGGVFTERQEDGSIAVRGADNQFEGSKVTDVTILPAEPVNFPLATESNGVIQGAYVEGLVIPIEPPAEFQPERFGDKQELPEKAATPKKAIGRGPLPEVTKRFNSVLDLWHTTDMTVQEIADKVKCNKQAVFNDVTRGRLKNDPRVVRPVEARAAVLKAAPSVDPPVGQKAGTEPFLPVAWGKDEKGLFIEIDEVGEIVKGPLGSKKLSGPVIKVLRHLANGELYGHETLRKVGKWHDLGSFGKGIQYARGELRTIGIDLIEVPKIGCRIRRLPG